MNENFPPATPHPDKAKYRQFLIDHGLDPNLKQEDLAKQYEALSDAEREQVQTHWREFDA